MKRELYIIPGLVDERHVLEHAAEKTKDGDNVFVHYHAQMQTCNSKCNQYELPKEEDEETQDSKDNRSS